MTGRISILKFLLTILVGTLLGGLVLGLFGFLLAGKEGFLNMAILGLVIGFFGALILRFAVLLQSYGLDTFGKTRVKNLEYGWFVKTRDDTKMKSK
jgi:Uncharacterized protein conserved in bacteria